MALIKISKIRGIKFRKNAVLNLDTEAKEEILKSIANDWRKLLDLTFNAEGGIIITGGIRKWKPLSERHADFKELYGYNTDILSMNTPTLLDRYKRSITINPEKFDIRITYPSLIGDREKGNPPDAGIHQLGTPQRRIILESFKQSVNKRLIEYIKKNS